MIYHLVNGIPENVDRCLGDHNADHDTGDRVQDRVSHLAPKMPTNAPIEESASERWCHASAIRLLN